MQVRLGSVSVMIGVLAVSLVAGCSKPTGSGGGTTGSKEPIKIGISAPISGPSSSIGQDWKEAVTMAVDEVNKAGGVLGRDLKPIFADNGCDPTTGANAVGNLIDVDKVAAVLGSSCSSVTLAVMPVIERGKVVQLEAGGTNAKITQQAGVGGNKWQFRLNIDDTIMAAAFANLIGDEVKSVAIVGSNDDFGRGAAAAFTANLKPKNVKITSTEYYARGQTDYRAMITKIKGDNPEALIVIADAPDAGPFAVQTWEMGLRNVKFYGRGTVVTPEFLKLTGDAKIWDGAKEVNRWAPTGSQFEKDYEAKWGRQPRVTGALPYYAVKVLAEAIKAAGSDDRTAIRDALEKVQMNIPEMGPIKFDDHHQAHHDLFITQWQNGKIATLQRSPTGN